MMWDKLFDVRALPKEADVFVCYDGRYSSKEEEAAAAQGKVKTDAVGGAVILVEHFLSDDEAMHLENMGWAKSSLHSDESDVDHGSAKMAYYVGKQYEGNFDLKAVKKQNYATAQAFDDEILNTAEERIAKFLKIPATPNENYLQLRLSNGPEVHSGGDKNPAIYHVKHNNLVRQATAMVGLRGGPHTMVFGGETVFPGLPRGTPASAGAKQTRLLKKLKGKVSHIMRNLGPDDAWPQFRLTENDKSYHDLLSVCNEANSSRYHEPTKYPAIEGVHGPEEGPILAVAPMPGRALFWWGEKPYVSETSDGKNISGEIIPDMWHITCPVIHGGKVAMVKYKNYGPDDENCKRSRWCKEAWERIGRAKQFAMEL